MKAFAKLMDHIIIYVAVSVSLLENLTGGVTERSVGYWGPLYPLEDENKKMNSLCFTNKISTTLETDGLVTASTFVMDKMNSGILGTPIQLLVFIPPEVDLIKIRNPWGFQFEWWDLE